MISQFAVHEKSVKCTIRHSWPRFAIVAILSFSGTVFGQGGTAQNEAAPTTPDAALDHIPRQLPTVTFRDGQLTIVAYNSSLHDILEMVRRQTGATMDVPEQATERVFVTLGPGPARRVLDSLLAGSSFNYVLLGSDTDPQALTKVLITPKPTGSGDSSAVAEANAAGPRRPFAAISQRQQPSSEEVEESVAPIQQASESAKSTAVAGKPVQNQEDAGKTDTATKADTTEKTETVADAAADNQSPADYPRTPNIRTAQEVLQDLYARRQAMQQQQQQHQSSPQ